MARQDICPSCGAGPVGVIDTRVYADRRIRRKRCGACDHRWTTAEVPVDRDRDHTAVLAAITEARAALEHAERALRATAEPTP